MVINSIVRQLHKTFPDIPIYTDRVDQKLQIPAFYVYLLANTYVKKLRTPDTVFKDAMFSYLIVYKNSENSLLQDDMMKTLWQLENCFDYLHFILEDGVEHVLQVNSLESSIVGQALEVIIRFRIPYKFTIDSGVYKAFDTNIKIKED